MPFLNRCGACHRNFCSPTSLIHHYKSIHGAILPSRRSSATRPPQDNRAAANCDLAACPACFFYCPIEDYSALAQHLLDVHDIDLEVLPNKENPPKSFGAFTSSIATSPSKQRPQRLPSPVVPANYNEEVENVIDTIIDGFNKFLNLVGRS